MAKLIDADSDFSERFRILHERMGREVEDIYPERVEEENGRILELGCSFDIFLSLITEKKELIFLTMLGTPLPYCVFGGGWTKGKIMKNGLQARPSEPILLLRKEINKIGGEDWYGDDKNAIIIFETYHCGDAGPKRTLFFLKKIKNDQLETFKNWAKKNNEKIEFFKIEELSEKQKENHFIRRIILLNNLFKPL
ncbi:hypothetical protein KKG29_02095 [Patescibacteria group bacterium]|nr:hypothetical protein [Patescibacteria group bacterium]MBU4056997.1 hypothetical protein [Patescibacteria group bacterium]